MVGGENDTKIKCGTPGKPCENMDAYPECYPSQPGEYWEGLMELMICERPGSPADMFYLPIIRGERAGTRPQGCSSEHEATYYDDATTPESETVIDDYLADEKEWEKLKELGYKGVCRSAYLGADKADRWYIYKDHGGMPEFLAYYNETLIDNAKDAAGFVLSPSEVKGLTKALNLGASDISFEPSKGPEAETEEKELPSGTKINVPVRWLPGTYNFTKRPERLTNDEGTGIIDKLKDAEVKVEGLSDVRREALISHLEMIHKQSTTIESHFGKQLLIGIGSLIIALGTAGMFAYFLLKQTRKMDDVMGHNAEISGENVKFEELVENEFEKQMKEWKETGTFEQPYIDTDARVVKILSAIDGTQADMTNYMSAGPSRAGKTASTLRGLTQALVVAQMTQEEREAFFEKTASKMAPQEAEVFRGSLESNALRIQKFIQRSQRKGVMVFNLPITKLKAAGAVWAGKSDKMLVEKVMDPVFKLAEEGYHVVLFMDEIQQAEDGNVDQGTVALRDKIKQWAEKDAHVTLAIATTIDELAETIAKDPASLNRYATVFHSAASPNKTVQILLLKPYVTDSFNVKAIDFDAMKAIYLLGQKATTKPSAHTSAEMYFKEVLQEAREAGLERVNVEFVFDHYDRNYASVAGNRGALTGTTVNKIFDYETKEIEEENARDLAKLRTVEMEAGGVKRINAPWYELPEDHFTDLSLREAVESVKAMNVDPAVSGEIVEAAGKMAEMYRHSPNASLEMALSREDAISAVVEKAVELARAEGADAPALDHVVRATGELCDLSIFAEDANVKPMLDAAVSLEDVQAAVAESRRPNMFPSAPQKNGAGLPTFEEWVLKSDPKVRGIFEGMKADGLDPDVESAKILKGMMEEMSEAERAQVVNPLTGAFKKGELIKLCVRASENAKKVGLMVPKAIAQAEKKMKAKAEADARAQEEAQKRAQQEGSGPHDRPTIPPPGKTVK